VSGTCFSKDEQQRTKKMKMKMKKYRHKFEKKTYKRIEKMKKNWVDPYRNSSNNGGLHKYRHLKKIVTTTRKDGCV
jgi:ribosomal protein L32E